MRKYVVMGPQGCGKGTQAKMLAGDFELVHISVGDIFRWHVQKRTKIGARVKRIVAAGELVPDDMVEDVVRTRLDQHDWNYGFVLDGFPRNAMQARFFLESYDIDAVIHIDVPDAVVMKRIISRRLCSQCGRDYNLLYRRPVEAEACDVCGGRLVQRPDDTEEAVRGRLRDYREKTQPILELFQAKEFVVTVDGKLPAREVQIEIRRHLALPVSQPEPAIAR
jgi:adenylate kinase